MAWFLAVAGVSLLIVVLTDLIKATLTLRGVGPITSRAAKLVWRVLKRADRFYGSKRMLTYGGPVIVLLTVGGWVFGQWIARALILSAEPGAVVASSSGEPADFLTRFYYAGFSLFTLGLGDFRPVGIFAQLATNLAASLGFLTISLSATYFIPTVSAAVDKRQLAIHISGLGSTPAEILACCWNGRDFSALAHNLTSLSPLIIRTGQQHLAYPVLHYYLSESLYAALPVQIASLHEALAILEDGVLPKQRLPPAIMGPALNGVGSYLASLRSLHLRPAPHAPPVPSLEPLRGLGVPVVDDATFLEAMGRRRFRRRIALSLVEDAGWDWSDVWPHSAAAAKGAAD